MRGLPDWGGPAAVGSSTGSAAWSAYQVDGIALVLPDALTVATEPDGRPAFHLSAFRPLVPMPGRKGYGRLDMILRLASHGATADGKVRIVPALRGWLSLSSNALALPPQLTAALPLDCSGLGVARLMLPLEAEGVAIMESALASGAASLLAAVDVEVAGVAARLPIKATVDVARLRRALANGAMTPAMLVDALIENPSKVGVSLAGAAADMPAQAIGEAVADHIRARLCAGPLALRSQGGGLALVLAETGIAAGTATLDIGEVVMATRALTIVLDPFAVARDLASAAGGLATLTTRSTSATLQSGQHDIVVDASVARPCFGPLALGATLVFAPRPPARPHEVREDFELPLDGRSVVRRVKLSANEPVSWSCTGFAFWPTPDGRGAKRLDGAAQAGNGLQVLLRPGDFPLQFVDVEAGAAVLGIANLEVGFGPARVTLTVAVPRATLAVPITTTDARLDATLVSRDGAYRVALPARPPADWRIELSDIPGYGARTMEITVTLPAGTPLRAIEVLAEDASSDAEVETYAFNAATPARMHHWFCRDPFRPGLRWRWRGQAAFSAPVTAARLDLVAEGVAA
ncbi:hypothetical protein [Reyranella sp.]|uniref:hypothetical protein n=1 Tax=Reyranella sp. TaxID=1929291 RepID=UPI003784D2F9